MNAVGVLLLAAATATSGIEFGKPHAGGLRILRPHAVMHGAPPASGMIAPAGPSAPGGAMAPGGIPRRFPNVRSQIFFVAPVGMNIGWQTAAGNGERVYLPPQLVVPARYNFAQGFIYRLKLTNIQGEGNLTLYPTLEVAPSTPATDAYLTHNPIPVQFTQEDFDQVRAGNFVTKVIYLPDPKYQELAIAGVETLVSTRLEPGVDPILEADKRGTILLIVRLGGIDLEMPNGSAGGVPSGPVMNAVGSPVMMEGSYPVDAAPAIPADSGGYLPPVDNSAGQNIPSAPPETAPVSPVPSGESAPPMPAPATPEPADAPVVPEVPGLGSLPPADAPVIEVPTLPGL